MTPGYYINVSQRNLANPLIIDWIKQGMHVTVCVIHDLIPITHSSCYCEKSKLMHEAKIQAVLRLRSVIICGSQTLSQELVKYADSHGLPVNCLVTSKFGSKRMARILMGTLPAKVQPYYLMLGTFEPRKNHRFILAIWVELIRRTGSVGAPNLVLVGRQGPESKSTALFLSDNPALAGKVSIIEDASDLEIAGLMKNAEATLIPSIAEGYGLPLYEAFSLGSPVIGSDIPVFQELAGKIARLISLQDPDDWVTSLMDFGLSDERLRQQDILRNWRRPTWAGHFRQLLTALESPSN